MNCNEKVMSRCVHMYKCIWIVQELIVTYMHVLLNQRLFSLVSDRMVYFMIR